MESQQFSVIIPAYNEGEAIGGVIDELSVFLASQYKSSNYEIVVVDDGSKDKTATVLASKNNIVSVKHPYNKGYGASLKTGVKQAKFDNVLFYDADGQHSPQFISSLVEHIEKYELVVGAREKSNAPFLRRPGKRILTWLAEYLVGQKIPDINSGFRIVKKKYFINFLNILPNGFSASTTLTLAMFKAGLDVKYVPIKVNKRIGKSTVKQTKHGLQTILLMLRVIMLFNPLKVFFPISIGLSLITVIWGLNDIISNHKITNSSVVLFITTVFIFCFGLLADQIAAIRRDNK